MYRSTKNKMRRRVPALVLAGALAAGGVVAGIGVAGAATHAERTHGSNRASSFAKDPQGPCEGVRAGGQISALSATSLTVKNLAGTETTYTLNSSTVVTKDRASASLSDLAVGERVHVIISPTFSSSAARVDIVTPHVLGQVVSVSGDVITLSNPDGLDTTVDVNGSTTYAKNGASATLSDVTVGSFVAASGTVASDHTTFDASSVIIGVPAGPMGSGPMGSGPMGNGPMGNGPLGSGPMGSGRDASTPDGSLSGGAY